MKPILYVQIDGKSAKYVVLYGLQLKIKMQSIALYLHR